MKILIDITEDAKRDSFTNNKKCDLFALYLQKFRR